MQYILFGFDLFGLFFNFFFQIFAFLALMCLILAIGNGIWEHDKGYYFQVYLPWAEGVNSASYSGFLMFWSYVIILNTVVPISLYVRYVPEAPFTFDLRRDLAFALTPFSLKPNTAPSWMLLHNHSDTFLVSAAFRRLYQGWSGDNSEPWKRRGWICS